MVSGFCDCLLSAIQLGLPVLRTLHGEWRGARGVMFLQSARDDDAARGGGSGGGGGGTAAPSALVLAALSEER